MKIKDLEEITTLAADDYIFLDSENGGPCKMLASQFMPKCVNIEATYTPSGTVYVDTPLDDLKDDLVVIATYETDITRTRLLSADEYTLSGTLSSGANIITVSYHGQTTTFTVTAIPRVAVYNWYYNNDKTLVVREKISDGSFRWYFDNYHVTQADYPFMPVPSNLQRFIMNSVTAYCSVNGNDNEGQIGFYEDVIRLWLYDLSLYVTGVVKGIMESTYTGNNNPYTWEEPTFDPYNG